MKAYLNTFLVLLGFTIVFSCNSREEHTQRNGNWIGTLTHEDQSLTIVLNFSETLFGRAECKISVSEQAVYNFEASDCQIINDSLFVKFSGLLDDTSIKGKFVNGKISGLWVQDKHSIPILLNATDERILFSLIIKRALNYAQQESVYQNRVNWTQLESEVFRLASSATEIEELAPALEHLLDMLKDKHGRVLIDNNLYRTTPQISRVSFGLRIAAFGNDKDVVAEILDRNVGYLRIPTSPIMDEIEIDKYIEKIQEQVCKLILNGAENWVVDLRLNGGGDTAAMLAGLYELFGDQKVGAIVGADGKVINKWFLKHGNIYSDSNQLTSVGKPCTERRFPEKIIILSSPITASAGEQVAISLKGFPKTIIIGEATRGLVTTTKGLPLTQNIMLFISTGYFTDRDGKTYRDYVYPDDEIFGGDDFENLKQDKKVVAALKWIKKRDISP